MKVLFLVCSFVLTSFSFARDGGRFGSSSVDDSLVLIYKNIDKLHDLSRIDDTLNSNFYLVNASKVDTVMPTDLFYMRINNQSGHFFMFIEVTITDTILPNETLFFNWSNQYFFSFENKKYTNQIGFIKHTENVVNIDKKTSISCRGSRIGSPYVLFSSVISYDILSDVIKKSKETFQKNKNSKKCFELNLKFESYESNYIDFVNFQCPSKFELTLLNAMITSQLDFSICNNKTGTINWEITNNKGSIVLLGELYKNQLTQEYSIRLEGLKPGNYTLTIGEKSNQYSKTFNVF